MAGRGFLEQVELAVALGNESTKPDEGGAVELVGSEERVEERAQKGRGFAIMAGGCREPRKRRIGRMRG